MLLINRQLRLLLTVVAYSIVVTIPVSFSFAQPTLPERYVYVWFPDGTLRRLSPAPGFFLQPCVRPDGKAAVFWGGAEGQPRVWLSEFASNAARPITTLGVGSVEPTFDWQGRRIVFASDVSSPTHLDMLGVRGGRRPTDPRFFEKVNRVNLFVINADGTQIRQITSGPFKDSRPAFDPEGKNIVFLSNRGGGEDGLYITSVDGSSTPRRLLKEPGIGRPWFSSDGQFVYFFFTGVPEEHRRICRTPVSGGSWEPVTPDGLPRSQGSFADPDGLHVWFHAFKEGKPTPYRFNIQTKALDIQMPPGFTSAGHMTRSRNGIITFDSPELVGPGNSAEK
jgi:hypothetical protein